MKMLYHFIINEHAGGGKGKLNSKKILQLAENNYSYVVHYSTYPGQVYEIMEELKPTLFPCPEKPENYGGVFPLIVVVGGDGTLHEVVNSLYPDNLDIPVAYIPSGSGNDFSRGTGISRDPIEAFKNIVKVTHPTPVNLITYEEANSGKKGVVVNNVGVGLDASIVAATNESHSKSALNKFKMGNLSYMTAILRKLFQQKGFPISIEEKGQEMEINNGYLFSISSHPYFGGGIPIAPLANPFENDFDVVMVEKIAFYKILYLIVLLTQQRHLENLNVYHIKGKELRFVSVIPQYAQLDGESWEKQSYDFHFGVTSGSFWLSRDN